MLVAGRIVAGPTAARRRRDRHVGLALRPDLPEGGQQASTADARPLRRVHQARQVRPAGGHTDERVHRGAQRPEGPERGQDRIRPGGREEVGDGAYHRKLAFFLLSRFYLKVVMGAIDFSDSRCTFFCCTLLRVHWRIEVEY